MKGQTVYELRSFFFFQGNSTALYMSNGLAYLENHKEKIIAVMLIQWK